MADEKELLSADEWLIGRLRTVRVVNSKMMKRKLRWFTLKS